MTQTQDTAWRRRAASPGAAALLGAILLAMGCGGGVGPGGALVGGTCNSDRECARRCITGDDNYPGGYCTVSCNNDNDCPGGTVCIVDNGGMCAVTCRVNADCAGFGRGFLCDARDRHGAPGGALVCRVP